IFRILPFDRINVLIYGVGCSLIPLFGGAKLWRNGEDEFTSIIRKDIPTQTDVTIQRIGFVLSEDTYSLQLRIDAIRQCKIDDSIDSAEGYGRFCPMFG